MRDYFAERIEALEQPLQFHHFHDRGVSDLHTGRFRVHFNLTRADAEWINPVVDWATNNCGVFELENIEPNYDAARSRPMTAYKDPVPRWQRALLFANESDATLTYLRFK
jgi:hypothetical protein